MLAGRNMGAVLRNDTQGTTGERDFPASPVTSDKRPDDFARHRHSPCGLPARFMDPVSPLHRGRARPTKQKTVIW